ncbi:hypothetical protein JXB01_01575 [Candidatus Micrarchaeota archaeon]|nr:hypothetical protein [Candidatus Micrarchaeota archaeon]
MPVKKSKGKKSAKKSPKTKKKTVKKPEAKPAVTKPAPVVAAPKMKMAPEVQPQAKRSLFGAFVYLIQILNPIILGLGALISLVLYLVRSDRFEKFHSLQSFFYGVVMSIVYFVMGDGIANGTFMMDASTDAMLYLLVSVLFLVITVLLSFKAYKKTWFELPFLGGISMRFL